MLAAMLIGVADRDIYLCVQSSRPNLGPLRVGCEVFSSAFPITGIPLRVRSGPSDVGLDYFRQDAWLLDPRNSDGGVDQTQETVVIRVCGTVVVSPLAPDRGLILFAGRYDVPIPVYGFRGVELPEDHDRDDHKHREPEDAGEEVPTVRGVQGGGVGLHSNLR